MTARLTLGVSGIGAWLPGAPDWNTLRGVLRGEGDLDTNAPRKPAGARLPVAERRRAPDGVRLAADVAAQACAMAGCDAATIPCVFASTEGELGITDYVCDTLARAPLELSPTKFHNSVLNAPAGYWTIATGCTRASSAVSAHHRSFAAGLFEAAVLAAAEATPVLFACGDVAATGPLRSVIGISMPFGVSLVLVPGAATGRVLHLAARAGAATPTTATPLPLALQDAARDNPANADALALLAALAGQAPASVPLALSAGLFLDMEIEA